MTHEPETARSVNGSVRKIDRKALRYLAKRDSHNQFAPVVRKLIAQEMRRELGSDWEIVLAGIDLADPDDRDDTDD